MTTKSPAHIATEETIEFMNRKLTAFRENNQADSSGQYQFILYMILKERIVGESK